MFDSERMEIKSGLSLEDNVIVTWSNELYEGASVNTAGDSAETETADSGAADGETAE